MARRLVFNFYQCEILEAKSQLRGNNQGRINTNYYERQQLLFGAVMLAATALPGHSASISGTILYEGIQSGPVHVLAAQTLPGNKALQLDGSSFVSVSSLTDLSGSELTVQYWFKGNSVQSAVRQQNAGYLVVGWNKLHILSSDGGTAGISAGNAITDGKWHHVIMTWKQGTKGGFASYLDGKLVDQRDSANTPIPNIDAPVNFGAFNGAGEFAVGLLDEIAIWRKSFTAEEVRAGWNKKLTGKETGLVGYWPFDDSTANDLSANARNGELGGNAAIVDAGVPGLGAGLAEVGLPQPGAFTLTGLPSGAGYAVFAFRDSNTNGVADAGEPAGSYAGNSFDLTADKTGVDVTLTEPPRFTLQPEPARTKVGGAASLRAQAIGSAPLSYQWRKDGVGVSDGARITGSKTSEITIASAQAGDSGVYTVVVANPVGAISSDPAALDVISGGAAISGRLAYSGGKTGKVYVTAAQKRSGNKVLALDGQGDYAITTLTDLSGSELSIQYWFKGSVSQSAVRQQSGGFIVSTWNGLHILSNDRSVDGIDAGKTVNDGNWHQVTVTWKQGTKGGFASYLDGKLVASRDSADVPIPNHNAQVYFGAFNGAGEYAKGSLDEIRIWRKSLSVSEIGLNWRASLTGNEDGLAGYWNFDDGVGADLSPAANNAELAGDAVIQADDIPGMGTSYTESFAGPGAYTIPTIPSGNGYQITAFMDLDGNRRQDAGEPLGAYSGNPFNLASDKTGVDIQLLDPPVFVQPLVSVLASPGSTVSFEAKVEGTAPLSYQWQKNGVDLTESAKISGARTAVLKITSVALDDEGAYRLTASNAVGTAVNSAALVVAASIGDRLIGHWKFDETSGDAAADGTGKCGPAVLSGYAGDDSQWITGKIGGALRFGGPAVSQYARVADYPKPVSTMSLSVWVWADSRSTWASIVKNWGGSQSGQFHFGLDAESGQLSDYLTMSGGGSASARETVPMPLGSWEHVAFVCDGVAMRLYHNGAEVGSSAYDGTLVAPSMASLGIGVKLDDAGEAPGSPAGYWHGKMDDLGIWGRALTPGEIYGIYQAGQAGKDLTQAVQSSPDVRLAYTVSAAGITLTWPASPSGFILESGPKVPSSTWSAVNGVVGNSVTVQPMDGMRFFRLRKP